MFRPASRTLLRNVQSSLAPGRTVSGRRFLTTEPPHRLSRSWKNSAARWGLAIAGIYFYNTSPAFADEPAFSPTNDIDDTPEEVSPLSLDSIPRRDRTKQQPTLAPATSTTPADRPHASSSPHDLSDEPTPASPADLEEEAASEGAFNPETGEINWDCPCLGGMAHGPCGEDFKVAFSCFVFSKEEPKGMDCIDNFKKMQDCFREHPDVYAGELADDEEDFEEGGEMAEERAELAKEIQERRKVVQDKQTHGDAEVSQKRSLEETSPSSRPAREPTPQKQQTHNAKAEVHSPASSEPHPGMAEEHRVADQERRETMSPSAPSQITRKPAPSSAQGTVDDQVQKHGEDIQIVPKAWHDAQDAKVPSEKK